MEASRWVASRDVYDEDDSALTRRTTLGMINYIKLPIRGAAWGGPFNGQLARQALFRDIIDSSNAVQLSKPELISEPLPSSWQTPVCRFILSNRIVATMVLRERCSGVGVTFRYFGEILGRYC